MQRAVAVGGFLRVEPFSDHENPWLLYYMVAHLTMRTHGVNQAFQFVEGILLHRKSRQIRFFFRKNLIFVIRAQCEMWETT